MAGLLITPPIILDNCGDMTAYESIEDALAYAEPVDVDNGEYRAFDAKGRAIVLGTEPGGGWGNRRTVVLSVEDPPRHAQDLQVRIVAYLQRLGEPVRDSEEDLPSVIARLLHPQTYE